MISLACLAVFLFEFKVRNKSIRFSTLFHVCSKKGGPGRITRYKQWLWGFSNSISIDSFFFHPFHQETLQPGCQTMSHWAGLLHQLRWWILFHRLQWQVWTCHSSNHVYRRTGLAVHHPQTHWPSDRGSCPRVWTVEELVVSFKAKASVNQVFLPLPHAHPCSLASEWTRTKRIGEVEPTHTCQRGWLWSIITGPEEERSLSWSCQTLWRFHDIRFGFSQLMLCGFRHDLRFFCRGLEGQRDNWSFEERTVVWKSLSKCKILARVTDKPQITQIFFVFVVSCFL